MSQSSALFAAFLVLALTGHVQAAEVDVPQGLSGNWRVQEVSGAEAAATPTTTLEIRPDGSYGGNGGCNTYRGNLKVDGGGGIAFAPAAATRKMCAAEIMDLEQKFFDALGTVKAWKIENGMLHLADQEGKHAVRLAALRTGTDILIHLPSDVDVKRETITYECKDGRKVLADYVNAANVSLAVLRIGEETVVASNVVAGSGARYAGGIYEWWSRGDEATLRDVLKDGNGPGVACRRS